MNETNSIFPITHQDQPLPNELVEELMADDILPEYNFDYNKARPNRLVAGLAQVRMVKLAPDIAAAFPTEQAVNNALRKLIESGSIAA